jgi:hypothetical protein
LTAQELDNLEETNFMPTPSDAESRSAKLQSSFKTLSAAANNLNAASDAFGEAVRAVDESLNKLNPGVEAWVVVSRSASDENAPWEVSEDRLGYAKTNGRWGLSLTTVEIDNEDGEEDTQGSWLFNDAPRGLRLRAIDHVPALVEALAREVGHTAKRVAESVEIAQQIAGSISAMAPMNPGRGDRR